MYLDIMRIYISLNPSNTKFIVSMSPPSNNASRRVYCEVLRRLQFGTTGLAIPKFRIGAPPRKAPNAVTNHQIKIYLIQ